MNYINEFETGPETAAHEFENYADKIWEIARQLHNAPLVANLKNDYISAAKVFGKKVVPAGAASVGHSGAAGRRVTFYRKVIRNAANYLNKALLSGYRGPSRNIVKHAFNRASQSIAQKTSPGITPPKFATTTPSSQGPYQSTTRGTSGTTYTAGPAPAMTSPSFHSSVSKGGKRWADGGAIYHGGTSGNCPPSSQKQGRWIKKGSTLLLEGVHRNTTCF